MTDYYLQYDETADPMDFIDGEALLDQLDDDWS